jgi:hypothetical protein
MTDSQDTPPSDDGPPPGIADILGSSEKILGIPAFLLDSMLTSLIFTAITRLPREKKLEILAMVAEVYAVYHLTRYWLADTCAGGSWNETVEEAVWFDSRQEAEAALQAAEIEFDSLVIICRVR